MTWDGRGGAFPAQEWTFWAPLRKHLRNKTAYGEHKTDPVGVLWRDFGDNIHHHDDSYRR
jgi:hypothetical protein